MARISYDSLPLAYSCCVLNQFFYLLGFWEGGLENLISIAFNDLCILPRNCSAPAQSVLHTGHHKPVPFPGAHACRYDPGTQLWQLILKALPPPVPHTHSLLVMPLTECPPPARSDTPAVKKNGYKARTQQSPNTGAF